MNGYNLEASNAWYSNAELNDTDNGDRKVMLQDAYEKLRDGADAEEVVMTAFLIGAAEGVAATADYHNLDGETFPDP